VKVAFVIEQDAYSGGGYFHTLHTLNVIAEELHSQDEVIVLTSSSQDEWIDISFNIKSHKERETLSFIEFVQTELDSFSVDLVFYLTPTPTPLYIRNAPYIYTIWDLGRFDLPAFPEYQHVAPFESNQEIFRKCLQSAVACIIPDVNFGIKLSKMFQIAEERLIEIPLSINPKLTEIKLSPPVNSIPGMIFYPAQFWAHKNHVRLVQALKNLQESDSNFHLVFSGEDKGSLENVKQFVVDQKLTRKVKFLGYVPNESIARLYQEAELIALPSYLGPNIMPIFEAWHFKKPIASSLVFQPAAGNGSIYFDPNSADSISDALLKSRDSAQNLINCGSTLLEDHKKNFANSSIQIRRVLEDFRIQRSTWKH